MASKQLIERMPKAELHVHIEGCLEPDLVLKLAERNNLQHKLPYKTLAEAEAAFQYDNLQEFLDLRDATLQVGSLCVLLQLLLRQFQPFVLITTILADSTGLDDRAGLLRGHNVVFEPRECSKCSTYRDLL